MPLWCRWSGGNSSVTIAPPGVHTGCRWALRPYFGSMPAAGSTCACCIARAACPPSALRARSRIDDHDPRTSPRMSQPPGGTSASRPPPSVPPAIHHKRPACGSSWLATGDSLPPVVSTRRNGGATGLGSKRKLDDCLDSFALAGRDRELHRQLQLIGREAVRNRRLGQCTSRQKRKSRAMIFRSLPRRLPVRNTTNVVSMAAQAGKPGEDSKPERGRYRLLTGRPSPNRRITGK